MCADSRLSIDGPLGGDCPIVCISCALELIGSARCADRTPQRDRPYHHATNDWRITDAAKVLAWPLKKWSLNEHSGGLIACAQ
jgi:hypothetical protein